MTLVTTMIQGRDVVVGIRDKKNWEQHTTQSQREDPSFKTSFGDGLIAKEPKDKPKVESPIQPTKIEEPNTESPKIEELPSTSVPPKERPSGANYRVEARKAMLRDRIASEDKFIDFYAKQMGLGEDDGKIKSLRGSVDRLRDQLNNVDSDDNPKLPHIPMGANTHTRSTQGFIHGNTRIKVQSGMSDNPAFNLLNDQVKSAWNSMPDEHRNLVKTLNIKRSRASEFRGGKAGSFNNRTGELIINISTSRAANVVSTMYHEIGHAKWYHINTTQPEKVAKFVEGMKAIGTAPTIYSESYRNFERVNQRSENEYRRKMQKGGWTVTPDNEEALKKNAIRAKTLYYNESHSELNSYAMGTLPKDRIIVSDDVLAKCLKVYKELYGLE